MRRMRRAPGFLLAVLLGFLVTVGGTNPNTHSHVCGFAAAPDNFIVLCNKGGVHYRRISLTNTITKHTPHNKGAHIQGHSGYIYLCIYYLLCIYGAQLLNAAMVRFPSQPVIRSAMLPSTTKRKKA
jgi:hypothetical protein